MHGKCSRQDYFIYLIKKIFKRLKKYKSLFLIFFVNVMNEETKIILILVCRNILNENIVLRDFIKNVVISEIEYQILNICFSK